MMNLTTDISIIVPVYNSAKTLNTCVDSILNQDFIHWELLLVDDGSTDNSLTICQEYEVKDQRIKSLSQTHQGVSSARNLALKEAIGKYVCFVDADDTIEPNYLSSLYQYHAYDMVIGGYFVDCYDSNKNLKSSTPHLPHTITLPCITNKEELLPLFMNGMIHINCNKLLNLDIIRKNQLSYSNYPVNEDYFFMVQYLMYAHSICTIPKPIYHWNRIENQKSGVNSMPTNILAIYNEAHLLTRDYFKNNDIADKILYFSYQFIVLKYFSSLNEKIDSSQFVFEELNRFHKNPLVKASYHAYKPQSKGEKIIHEIQKRGYFRLYYLLRQTILKWIS